MSGRTVVHAALGGAIDADALERAVEAALDGRGFVRGLGALHLRIYASPDRAFAVLEGDGVAIAGLAAAVATRVHRVVTFHEVRGRDEPFDLQVRSAEVGLDGALRSLELDLEDDELGETHGDQDETVQHFLWRLLDPEDEEDLRPGASASYAEAVSPLSPRLADLAHAIEAAGAWRIERQGARWLVRIEGPAGKRMSAVTPEELALLRARVPTQPILLDSAP